MKIIECPRDAMQGLTEFISTEKKITYLNQLLKVGFDTVDFGSFVSPKAIPQMRDTKEVIAELEWKTSSSKLLAIVANVRGADEAASFDAVRYLGFPLSISETFQQRNTHASIAEAFEALKVIQSICVANKKQLVTYISMGFGNPYDDPYSIQTIIDFVARLFHAGVTIVSLSDTIGVSSPSQIQHLLPKLMLKFPSVEFGLHLHSTPQTSTEKIEAAFRSGLKRFDGALKGWGGCPMATEQLVGNLATERIIDFMDANKIELNFDRKELAKTMLMADAVFPIH
jgi:hydroxymethylglutaryl-CoA lyase